MIYVQYKERVDIRWEQLFFFLVDLIFFVFVFSSFKFQEISVLLLKWFKFIVQYKVLLIIQYNNHP